MSLVTETDGGAQVTAQARSRHRYQRYERQTSAGGVVYRIRDGQMEVLLCGRKEPLLWCLPKGTPDPGEGIRATAVREVQEETGVSVIIQGKLGSVHYFFMRVQYSTRCDKDRPLLSHEAHRWRPGAARP